MNNPINEVQAVKVPRKSNSFPVVCLECGKKFKTASFDPQCPKCGGVDLDVQS
jgi:Zn finger protein HypA/HybF involved in hydrogenase expression